MFQENTLDVKLKDQLIKRFKDGGDRIKFKSFGGCMSIRIEDE